MKKSYKTRELAIYKVKPASKEVSLFSAITTLTIIAILSFFAYSALPPIIAYVIMSF
jgi:hypothetical protein